MNKKTQICNMSNISTTVQKEEKYKSQALHQDQCHCCPDFHALVRTIPDASNSGPLFAFNDGEAELALTSRRCNIAMLICHDVEASRRYRLLTFILVDPTSQRWSVTKWGRRNVPAIFMHFLPLLQNASKNYPFHTNCTCIHTN